MSKQISFNRNVKRVTFSSNAPTSEAAKAWNIFSGMSIRKIDKFSSIYPLQSYISSPMSHWESLYLQTGYYVFFSQNSGACNNNQQKISSYLPCYFYRYQSHETREDGFFYNGNQFKMNDPSSRAMAILIATIRQWRNSLSVYSEFSYKNKKTKYTVHLVEVTSSSGEFVITDYYYTNTNAVNHVLMAKTASINGKTIDISFPAIPYMTGFYYGSGYKIKNDDANFYQSAGQYIGFSISKDTYGSDFTTVSGPGSDLSKIGGSEFFELINTNAENQINNPYYTQVNKNGNTMDGGSGGTGTATIATAAAATIKIPEMQKNYTEQNTIKLDNYIRDYGKFKINFIPVDETGFEADTNKTTLDIKINKDIEKKINGQPRILSSMGTSTIEKMLENLDIYSKSNGDKPYCIISSKENPEEKITLVEYFVSHRDDYKGKYNFEFNDGKKIIDFNTFLVNANKYLKNELDGDTGYVYSTSVLFKQDPAIMNIISFELLEAYTRGRDFIEENYTIVRSEERDPRNEAENSCLMDYDDNYFRYKYSGRDIDLFCHRSEDSIYTLPQDYDLDNLGQVYCQLIHECDILLETDITLGETYGEQEYFIEAVKVPKWTEGSKQAPIKIPSGKYNYYDTFNKKQYLDDIEEIDSTLYTEDDLEIIKSKIDLTKCQYYYPIDATKENQWCDCRYGDLNTTSTRECVYQKLGYCPYRFNAEKHPRRIRTLQQSKSNRFNLIQELSKVFQYYPYFYIEHDKNGRVILDENGEMKKHVFFMTEKGNKNQLGFRYEKNLSNITRTIDSNAITTKLYVENQDSSINSDGICSISTAADNIGKNNYILDFSYYTTIGALDEELVERDLYGLEENDFAFLTRIGAYNQKYDDYSNLIITMSNKTLTELMGNVEVLTTSIKTTLEEKQKVAQSMYQYKAAQDRVSDRTGRSTDDNYKTSDSYKNYLLKYRELSTILWGNIEKLFYSGVYCSFPYINSFNEVDFITLKYDEDIADSIYLPQQGKNLFNFYRKKLTKGELLWRLLIENFDAEGVESNIQDSIAQYHPPYASWDEFKEKIIDKKLYQNNGLLGKLRGINNEIQYWKRERQKILNKINLLSEQFYKKYEPYIKEGTFSSGNYLDDNTYYWASVDVLSDSSSPKITYTITPIDISPLPEFKDDYNFDLADTTHVEDIDFFGINKHTGLPNKEKVLVSSVTEYLDQPSKNNFGVQNYSSQFADLFSAITASVQSLTFNENIYRRASNFTAKQHISTNSLQGGLDAGGLTLMNTAKDNITIDEEGTQGNDIDNAASKFKVTGEGILFSTDGGETWDIGIGPKGINLDYAKFGTIDTSKLQIVNGDYIYFLWDKDGINAYRSPAESIDGLEDFARFNKYGLSLIEKGNVRLRAGYEFKNNEIGENESGDYKKEVELSNQKVGFYLYNDDGQAIFRTETASLYEDDNNDYSARLSLSGEMFITNNILSSNKINSTKITYEKQLKGRYEFSNNEAISFIKVPWYKYLYSPTGELKEGVKYCINSQGESVTEVKLNGEETYTLYEVKQSTKSSKSYEGYEFLYEALINTYNNFSISGDEYEDTDVMININDLQLDVNPFDYEYNDKKIEITFNYNEQYYQGTVGRQISSASYGSIDEQTQLTLIEYKESETIIPDSQDLIATTIHYINQEGQSERKDLYHYGYNQKDYYWESYSNTDKIIDSVTTDFSLNEIGIFINNKKSLKIAQGEATDNTLIVNQDYSNDEFQSQVVKSLFGGNERIFNITANTIDEKGNHVYRNIFSILKNGALYMGGKIVDEFGAEIDLKNLSQLPDSIRIVQPSLIMTNNGTIFCDWNKFYNMGNDKDGNWGLGTVPLMKMFDYIIDFFNDNVANSGGGDVSGWYVDDDDIE